MSRANFRVARDLVTSRYDDSIKANKSILKADAYGASERNLANKLNETNDQYLAKLSRLQKFTAKSKTAVRSVSHKTEWISEQDRLQGLAIKIENSVGSILQGVLVASPDCADLYELLANQESCFKARKHNHAQLTDQLRNLKEMLREAKKMAGKLGFSATASSTESTQTESARQTTDRQDPQDTEGRHSLGNMAVMSIIADLLMKIRSDQAKAWAYLSGEEAKLKGELSGMNTAINQMLRADHNLVQDAKLREEFMAILAGLSDPATIHLASAGSSVGSRSAARKLGTGHSIDKSTGGRRESFGGFSASRTGPEKGRDTLTSASISEDDIRGSDQPSGNNSVQRSSNSNSNSHSHRGCSGYSTAAPQQASAGASKIGAACNGSGDEGNSEPLARWQHRLGIAGNKDQDLENNEKDDTGKDLEEEDGGKCKDSRRKGGQLDGKDEEGIKVQSPNHSFQNASEQSRASPGSTGSVDVAIAVAEALESVIAVALPSKCPSDDAGTLEMPCSGGEGIHDDDGMGKASSSSSSRGAVPNLPSAPSVLKIMPPTVGAHGLSSCDNSYSRAPNSHESVSENGCSTSGRNSCSNSASGGLSSSGLEALELELEELMHEWLERVAQLDRDHAQTVAAREAEKAAFCTEVDLDPTIPLGGWSSEQHDIFVKIYRRAQVTGMKRKLMLELLASQLPTQPMDAILLHEEWYRKMKQIAARYKESDATYSTTRYDLIELAKRSLIAHREQRLEEQQREMELERQERRRAEVHHKLMELRAVRDIVDATKHQEHLLEQEVLAEKLREQEEALRRERLEKKAQVERFRQLREVAEAEQREAQRRREAEAARRLREMVEESKPKVEKRRQKLQEKDAQRRQREVCVWGGGHCLSIR